MKLEDVISIDSSPSHIWNVTVDIEHWPEWTPTVTAARRLDDGPFDVGSAALVEQPGLPKARWVVSEFVEGERFTWETRVRGMRMVATHEVTPRGADGATSTLRLEISGMAALILSPILRRSAKQSLARENAGLKNACELREPR